MKRLNKKRNKLNEKSDKIDSRYKLLKEKIAKQELSLMPSKLEIREFPIVKASLYSYRKEEMNYSVDKNKGVKSFLELFHERMLMNESKRENVSIVIHVKVKVGYFRENSEEKDEFMISKKKEIRSRKYNTLKGKHIDKLYGPFNVEKPIGISRQDTYKFEMYTLLKKKFTILSIETIKAIGCKIIKLNKKYSKKVKMGQLKLESYLLNKQKPITKYGENTCVIDYVWNQVRGKRGFKTYTYDKLKNEIYNFVPEGDKVSTEELINWAKASHPNVSIHAFDCRYKRFITHSKHCSNKSLVYIVKDNHCWPITDEKLKIVASKANQGGCDNLLKHMADLKWTKRHDNIMKLKSVDDMSEIKNENHIVILPEEIKMNRAIDFYCKTSNFYVEYLHWNNNGVLDGFIDHRQNMFL